MHRFPRQLTLALIAATLSISPCLSQDIPQAPPSPGNAPKNVRPRVTPGDDGPADELFRIVAEEALKESATDDEIRKLMKARYQNAVMAFEMLNRLYESGTCEFEKVLDASKDTFIAALELCRTPSEKIAVLEKIVKVTKELEEMASLRMEGASGSTHDLYLARAKRYDAQIQLLRAKKEAAADKKK